MHTPWASHFHFQCMVATGLSLQLSHFSTSSLSSSLCLKFWEERASGDELVMYGIWGCLDDFPAVVF